MQPLVKPGFELPGLLVQPFSNGYANGIKAEPFCFALYIPRQFVIVRWHSAVEGKKNILVLYLLSSQGWEINAVDNLVY